MWVAKLARRAPDPAETRGVRKSGQVRRQRLSPRDRGHVVQRRSSMARSPISRPSPAERRRHRLAHSPGAGLAGRQVAAEPAVGKEPGRDGSRYSRSGRAATCVTTSRRAGAGWSDWYFAGRPPSAVARRSPTSTDGRGRTSPRAPRALLGTPSRTRPQTGNFGAWHDWAAHHRQSRGCRRQRWSTRGLRGGGGLAASTTAGRTSQRRLARWEKIDARAGGGAKEQPRSSTRGTMRSHRARRWTGAIHVRPPGRAAFSAWKSWRQVTSAPPPVRNATAASRCSCEAPMGPLPRLGTTPGGPAVWLFAGGARRGALRGQRQGRSYRLGSSPAATRAQYRTRRGPQQLWEGWVKGRGAMNGGAVAPEPDGRIEDCFRATTTRPPVWRRRPSTG